jgi:hypothetical protein
MPGVPAASPALVTRIIESIGKQAENLQRSSRETRVNILIRPEWLAPDNDSGDTKICWVAGCEKQVALLVCGVQVIAALRRVFREDVDALSLEMQKPGGGGGADTTEVHAKLQKEGAITVSLYNSECTIISRSIPFENNVSAVALLAHPLQSESLLFQLTVQPSSGFRTMLFQDCVRRAMAAIQRSRSDEQVSITLRTIGACTRNRDLQWMVNKAGGPVARLAEFAGYPFLSQNWIIVPRQLKETLPTMWGVSRVLSMCVCVCVLNLRRLCSQLMEPHIVPGLDAIDKLELNDFPELLWLVQYIHEAAYVATIKAHDHGLHLIWTGKSDEGGKIWVEYRRTVVWGIIELTECLLPEHTSELWEFIDKHASAPYPVNKPGSDPKKIVVKAMDALGRTPKQVTDHRFLLYALVHKHQEWLTREPGTGKWRHRLGIPVPYVCPTMLCEFMNQMELYTPVMTVVRARL